MAMYSSARAGWTPVNHADGASSLADASYHAITTIAANTARINEVFVGGEATSSTVNRMTVRRTSTVANTPTSVAPAPLSPTAPACSVKGFSAATTGSTIASTGHLLNLAMNAFGGIIRWVAAPGEELWITGATQPNAEAVLDSISGTGVVSTHMIFEEV